jgi:glycosyltransferase involved in cell wall biosynthesis
VAGKRQRRRVTFVNPEIAKGVFVFVAIAARLAAIRPDIPLMVVEGRTPAELLTQIGIDLARLPNVIVKPPTADPREFYAVTKLILMPSVWKESFGLVAAEALINGIPVLASNRGSLPEVVGDGGFLFDIPGRYTPETQDVPTAGEVQPWVDTIIRLWDQPGFYAESCQRAHARAQAWHPDRLGPMFQDFFANVSPQPAPPIVA